MLSPIFQMQPEQEPAVFPPPGYVPGTSKVPGIDVYVPSESAEKRPEVVDFKCPKCGASLGFNVEAGKLSCTYCGYSETPAEKRLGQSAEAFEFRVETVERSERGWGEARKELVCQRCGGVVSVSPDALTFTCPFCGSNKVLSREPMEDVLRPRCLIPFKIDPAECRAITRKWLGSSWMIPAELRNAAKENATALETYHPLYIPYWTFGAICNATWKAQVAKETTEIVYENGAQVMRRKVTWKTESGKVQKAFNDLLVPGTTRLNLKALGQVDNYAIADLVLYEPGLLAGMQVQPYNLRLEEAWDAGRQVMREETRRACLDHCSSSTIRNFTMALDFSEEKWRYILAPIYTSVYHYGEKTFQILINGQTGLIAGARPVDWEKIWLVVAGLLLPGLLLSLFGWLFLADQTGSMTTAAGMFLMVVAITTSFFIVRRGMEMEHV